MLTFILTSSSFSSCSTCSSFSLFSSFLLLFFSKDLDYFFLISFPCVFAAAPSLTFKMVFPRLLDSHSIFTLCLYLSWKHQSCCISVLLFYKFDPATLSSGLCVWKGEYIISVRLNIWGAGFQVCRISWRLDIQLVWRYQSWRQAQACTVQLAAAASYWYILSCNIWYQYLDIRFAGYLGSWIPSGLDIWVEGGRGHARSSCSLLLIYNSRVYSKLDFWDIRFAGYLEGCISSGLDIWLEARSSCPQQPPIDI